MRQVSKKTLNLGGKLLALDTPIVMGILNVTTDSFYSKSRLGREDTQKILDRATTMLTEGATILDIGGYSTRPGASSVNTTEETDRVLPVIKAIRGNLPEAILSIDTFRAGVAEAAVEAGADIINDVSGGNLSSSMFETVARLRTPYILTHMRGTPETMNDHTYYEHFPADILTDLQEKLKQLRDLGATDIIVDPGFGFAKTIDQNFGLLRHLQSFHELDCPILAGLSRKSAIYKTLDITPEDALNGTTVLNTVALMAGAHILRVHDPAEARQAITLIEKIRNFKL